MEERNLTTLANTENNLEKKRYQAENSDVSDREVYLLCLGNKHLQNMLIGAYPVRRSYEDMIYHVHGHTIMVRNMSPPIAVHAEKGKDIQPRLEALLGIKLKEVEQK